MRGKTEPQPDFLTVVNLNAVVPAEHPLRAIKRRVDIVLKKLSPLFDELYAQEGRASIPPEQLLKSRVLMALYTVRSERLFCEQLAYNLLWLWFLDREFSQGAFDHSIFAKNYQRVLSAEVARLFFAEIYDLSRQEGWASHEHFTADGTLIESWASLKSFVRKDGADAQKVRDAKDDDPGNPTVNFHGEKRCNDTHQSATDPDSVLYKKAAGKEAKLCFGGHVLMENRHGLCADFTIHNPIRQGEPAMALRQIDEHSRIDPKEDNMLKITSEGRKGALDLRLLNSRAGDHPDSKVNRAADQIFEIWKQNASARSAQLVFCDLSTPSHFRGRFSVYDDLKKKLVNRGVPENEIAFIQDFDSDAQKLALFKDVRAGRVRILMGSTQKMGTGANVQERLIALHHLDAPWRPADVEQREGRILRQGNSNAMVQIYRYVTEGSFDAYMWQTLETKARFIHQVMTGDTHVRRIEDIDSRALTYAEVKAIASGNPLVIEKASIDAEIARLTRLRSQHAEAQYHIRSRVRRLGEEIPLIQERLANLKLDIAQRKDTGGDAFVIQINGNTLSDRVKAGDAVNLFAAQIAGSGCEKQAGEFAGFRLILRAGFLDRVDVVLKGKNTYSANLSDSGLGTIRSMEYVIQNLDECQERYGRELAESEKHKRELESKIGQPFEYDEKLQSLSLRQQEIVKALDITKNQASSDLDSANPSEQESVSVAVDQTQETRRRVSVRV